MRLPQRTGPSTIAALCRCLRPRLTDRDRADLERIVERDLDALAAVAEDHELAPTLWASLLRRRLVQPVPVAIRRVFETGRLHSTTAKPVALWLEDAQRETVAQISQVRGQLAEVVGVLNEAGVVPVPLKGARWLNSTQYPQADSRSMVDIDLLVRPEEAALANDALIRHGYFNAHYPLRDAARRNTHLVPLQRADLPVPVELHVELGDWPSPEILPARTAWTESSTCPFAGDTSLHVRHLSPTHTVLHTILHSEIHHRGHTAGKLSLRALYDLAATAATTDENVDWVRIREAFGCRSRVLDAFVLALHELFDEPVPDAIVATRRASAHLRRCLVMHSLPGWLARLLEQVAVFPGTLDARRISYLYDRSGFVSVNAARARHIARMLRLTATRAGRA